MNFARFSSFARRYATSSVPNASHYTHHQLAEVELAHSTAKTWKMVSYFVAVPAVLLTTANTYAVSLEEAKHESEHEHHEPVHYGTYMRIRTKPFPWGDGDHSLFHNDHTNH